MARPAKKIEAEQFESLCNLQCTLTEIAGFFKCSEDTIENWCKRTYSMNFSECYKKYSQNGKISLRRAQWRLAEKGNASMLIWLGKQWLGQTDKVEQTTSFEDLTPLADMLKLTPEELKIIEGANATNKLE